MYKSFQIFLTLKNVCFESVLGRVFNQPFCFEGNVAIERHFSGVIIDLKYVLTINS